MTPVPWRQVESWNCLACSRCCRGFDVVLNFKEWLKIVRTYGVGVTKPSVNRLYMGKRDDDTCVFLYRFFNRTLCGLQHMKPKACMLWPFKIHTKPRYGKQAEASFIYLKNKFFVYVDARCAGVRWGVPVRSFVKRTLPEFIEIALGLRVKQSYTTSEIPYRRLP